MALEGQLKPSAWEVLDGRDLLEQFLKAVGLEPLERVQLHLNQVWNVEYGRSLCKGAKLVTIADAVFRHQHSKVSYDSLSSKLNGAAEQPETAEGAADYGVRRSGMGVRKCRELTKGISRHQKTSIQPQACQRFFEGYGEIAHEHPETNSFPLGLRDIKPGQMPSRSDYPSTRLRRSWSGRRDLNPRHLPWQGSALPLSYSRSPCLRRTAGAEGRNRTGDTSIFSAVLYQLSYLGVGYLS